MSTVLTGIKRIIFRSGFAGTNNGDGTTTIDLAASGVTPDTYGDSTHIPILTVGADGRVTAASETTPASAGVSSLAASGDTPMSGALKIAPGANVTVVQDDVDTITIAAVAGSGAFGTGTSLPGSPADGDAFLLRLGSTPYDFIGLVYDATLAKWVSDVIVFGHTETNETTTSTSYVNVTNPRAHLPFHKAAYDAGLRLQVQLSAEISNSGANTSSLRVMLQESADASVTTTVIATSPDPTVANTVATIKYFWSAWVDFTYSPAPSVANVIAVVQKKTSAGTATFAPIDFRLRWVSV